jgi:hypothetical protein
MKEIGAPALPEDINRDLLTSPHSFFSYLVKRTVLQDYNETDG